jgi:hypothetical protein
MHIEPTRTDVIASRQGNISRSAPGKKRTEHTDRSSHFADEVIVSPVLKHYRHIDNH